MADENGAFEDDCVVVLNADLPWAYKNLLAKTKATLPKVERYKYTSSAFMMYLGTRKRYDQLLHHNVMFGGDYRGSFTDILEALSVALHDRARQAVERADDRAARNAARAMTLVEESKLMAGGNVNPQLITANLLSELERVLNR